MQIKGSSSRSYSYKSSSSSAAAEAAAEAAAAEAARIERIRREIARLKSIVEMLESLKSKLSDLSSSLLNISFKLKGVSTVLDSGAYLIGGRPFDNGATINLHANYNNSSLNIDDSITVVGNKIAFYQKKISELEAQI